ncbi:hypothetical protein, partial [uncultured Dubosiella sp.]
MDKTKSSTIHLTVIRNDDFLSPYWADRPVISGEAASILDNLIQTVPQNNLKHLQIDIASDGIDAKEKGIYREAIHYYYENELKNIQRKQRKNVESGLTMLAIGAGILTLHALGDYLGLRPVTSEILDIAGWVFIWQAVTQFGIERHKMNLDRVRIRALANAKIVYSKLDSQARKVMREENK